MEVNSPREKQSTLTADPLPYGRGSEGLTDNDISSGDRLWSGRVLPGP
jgi:hypothetical protein